jgi:transglutaminase-like putative cysteine protease
MIQRHPFRAALAAGLVLLGIATGQAADPAAGTPSRADVRRRFEQTRDLAKHRRDALFGVFRQALTGEERTALEFLYAYMPLADLADHDGDFYLAAVRASLRARRELPWGPQIPGALFRHFVLPLRVNNETLDTFRQDHYAELKARVAGLTLRQAVLEINHWCNERVIYQGTDARTSAPLATIRTGYGRCGEESVLAVAALRAAGIPARQCYTPRWAHTDDNHAWVEAWVDGAWHYLGACEPEPELDLAWFREPVRRAMLVHTRVYGAYAGPEPVLENPPLGPVLNLTAGYAPLREVRVRVVDADGRPAAGAEVSFRLYNYAELYPLATFTAGPDGRAALACGRGSVLVWARKDGRFGWAPSPPGPDGEITVRLDTPPVAAPVAVIDLAAPPMPPPFPLPAEGLAANARRLEANATCRAAHAATFMADAAARELAASTGQDPAATAAFIARSAGNWRAVADFLHRCPAALRPWAIPLLETLSDKDLRDAPPDVLLAHLAAALADPGPLAAADRELFVRAVLAPRIDTETLVAWREPLRRAVPGDVARRVRRDPRALAAWLDRRIARRDDRSPYRLPVTPRGVMELRVADAWSRDIGLVALARSLGIPARLHPALRTPEFHRDGRWIPFAAPAPAAPAAAGTVSLQPAGDAGAARYFVHFSLARLAAGAPETLEFPEGQPAREWGAPELPAGDYLLVTGNRQHDGSVLARLTFFALPAGGAAEVPLVIRQPAGPPRVLGRLPDGAALSRPDGASVRPLDLAGGRGLVLAWLEPGTEPTRHVLAELANRRAALEAWGGAILLVLPPNHPVPPPGGGLPDSVTWVHDPDEVLLAGVRAALGATLPLRPVVLMVPPAGDIVHASEGYTIGTADRILEIGESVNR